MMVAYHKRLTSEDDQIRTEAAKAWSKWEYVVKQVFQSIRADAVNLGWQHPSSGSTQMISRGLRRMTGPCE